MACPAFPPNDRGALGVGQLDHTAELQHRPTRPADHRAENAALLELAQAVAATPTNILQAVADTLLTTLRAGSCGVCLVSMREGRVQSRWAALAGVW